jgi:RNA polymerase sigma-70 factor (ECF subfamily)
MAVAAEALETDRRVLWGLCYRMTGNAADADDVVQEAFVRALERPPRNTDEPLRPWLIRVAMNLCRDLLRKRKRQRYVGDWLPSPVPTSELESPASYEPVAPSEENPAARYDLLESVSFAFLLALEALTPNQRAVLLLRDVFDYSTEETAAALDLSEANVKVLLLRARRKMRDYDNRRVSSLSEIRQTTRTALEQFLTFLRRGDARGIEQLLTEDAVDITDGGGEVRAALRTISGRSKVVRLIFGVASKLPGEFKATFVDLNGLPAILFETQRSPGYASRFTFQCEVDETGRIRRILNVLAPSKLVAIPA